MALDQAFAKATNDYIHGTGAAPTLAAGRKLKLCSAVGTPTTPGTEITPGGNYTAGGVAATYVAATSATPSVSAINALNITNMPAAASIAAIELTDNAGTPVRIEYGSLTQARSTAAGDTLSFAQGAVTSALGGPA